MTETLQRDVPCCACAYNLRGLGTDAACPECGAAVDESVLVQRVESIRWEGARRNARQTAALLAQRPRAPLVVLTVSVMLVVMHVFNADWSLPARAIAGMDPVIYTMLWLAACLGGIIAVTAAIRLGMIATAARRWTYCSVVAIHAAALAVGLNLDPTLAVTGFVVVPAAIVAYVTDIDAPDVLQFLGLTAAGQSLLMLTTVLAAA